MLGTGGNSGQSKILSKKSELQQLQQKDYQRIIDQKDHIIRKLQFKVQKLEKEKQQMNRGGSQGNKGSYFKEKLQVQIKNNHIALDLLISLNNRIAKITELLRLSNDFSEDTEVNNLIKMMGDANQSLSRFDNEEEDSVDSESEDIQSIKNQSNKMIQELEVVCDGYHKNFLKIQKQYLGVEKKLKDVNIQTGQEIKNLSKEMNDLRKQKEQLTVLLQKNEKDKNDLMISIANSLDQKSRRQVEKMNRDQLLEYIKKQGYKINQLETVKTQIIRQNKKIKTQDYQKYKKILTQVKQVKQMSRMGQSMM